MALSRDDVVLEALSILDRYGLSDLTMRRLAANLGVQPGALYWHFANKQTLFDAMATHILTELASPSAGDWEASLQSWAARLHALLRRYRGGAELVSGVLALRVWADSPARDVEQMLLEAGFAAPRAIAAASGVLYLVIGHSLHEEQAAQFHELGIRKRRLDADHAAQLDVAVSFLLAGLKQRESTSEAPPGIS